MMHQAPIQHIYLMAVVAHRSWGWVIASLIPIINVPAAAIYSIKTVMSAVTNAPIAAMRRLSIPLNDAPPATLMAPVINPRPATSGVLPLMNAPSQGLHQHSRSYTRVFKPPAAATLHARSHPTQLYAIRIYCLHQALQPTL